MEVGYYIAGWFMGALTMYGLLRPKPTEKIKVKDLYPDKK